MKTIPVVQYRKIKQWRIEFLKQFVVNENSLFVGLGRMRGSGAGLSKFKFWYNAY